MTSPFRAVFGAAALTAALLAPSALRRRRPRSVRPSSVASTGDSVTRAFNTGAAAAASTRPPTRGAPGTNAAVAKPLRPDPGRAPGHRGPDLQRRERRARAWSDLLGQVTTAGSRRVDYVTVLMGANDVCRSSEAAMTSVANLPGPVCTAAVARLSADASPTRASTWSAFPDVHRLWEVLSGEPPRGPARVEHVRHLPVDARSVRCPSRAPEDVERRERVRARGDRLQRCSSRTSAPGTSTAGYDGRTRSSRRRSPPADVSSARLLPSVASPGQARLAADELGAPGFDFSDASGADRRRPRLRSGRRRPVAASVALGACDDVGVAGIEYRTQARAHTSRYTGPAEAAAAGRR